MNSSESNSSVCNYDSGECINDPSQLNLLHYNHSYFADNATYCDSTGGNRSGTAEAGTAGVKTCLIDWIDDNWCDDNCRTKESCFYDNDDCICDSSKECFEMTNVFSLVADTTYVTDDPPNVEHMAITHDGMCALWDLFNQVGYIAAIEDFPFLLEWQAENRTCDYVFNQMDINNNSLVQFDEMLYLLSDYLEMSHEKISQINCTSCWV